MEPVHVRALNREGRPVQVKLGGCGVDSAPDRFFFTISYTHLAPEGDLEPGYVLTATQRYKAALETGLDPKFSILMLEGLSKLNGQHDPEQINDFLARMRAIVRAYTLGGEAADVFENGAMTLVHSMDLDDSTLHQSINDLAVRVFDAPLAVETFTVDMTHNGFSGVDGPGH